VFKV